VSAARLVLVVAAASLLGLACRQDMHDQPRYEPFEKSDFFADGRASRPFVAGTVARGTLHENEALFTGKVGKDFVSELPMEVTADLLLRGRTQFEAFCSPCHGRTGQGDGMIVQRGFKRPPSYHTDRLRGVPVGYFFDVMTKGFGAMSDYASQVSVEDRWAIAAYVRTLQLSQHAPVSDVPAERRADLEASLGVAPLETEHH
jgi:mono/diheme cytochrome c family protein